MFDITAGPDSVALHYKDFNNDPFYNGNNQPPLYNPNPAYDFRDNIGQVKDNNNDGVDNSVDNITNHDIGEN